MNKNNYKNIIMALLSILIALPSAMMAQTSTERYMVVTENDGKVTVFNFDEVESVSEAFAGDNVTAMRLAFHDNVTIVPEGLSEASPEGTVGTLGGVEAIVVDLGGIIGKVAIATLNAGADNTNEYIGRKFSFADANNASITGLTNGWYVPSKDEMEALMSRLSWNVSRAGAEISGTSLFLPAAGYNDTAKGTQTVYWTSTAQGSQGRGWRLDMSNNYRTVLEGNGATLCSVRSFHALPKVENLTAPIEREHNLHLSSIAPSADGKGITLTVNGASVTYPFGLLKEMTFFDGTPTVVVKANEDPENMGNYYSTFYSSLEAYNIPDDVSAYTAKVEGSDVKLTEIEDGIIPQGEAVLLRSKTTANMSMTIADEVGEKSTGNQFSGVDVSTDQDGITHYMLSYGQEGLGFYKMNSAMVLSPNKAFIESQANAAKPLRFVFPDDMLTGIDNVDVSDTRSDRIFNLSGMRLSKMQKGINIMNGKKVIIK